MTNREKIWDMIYDLMPEPQDTQLPLYEGIKKYEIEVQDIVTNIEELAGMIETAIDEKAAYEMEREKGE